MQRTGATARIGTMPDYLSCFPQGAEEVFVKETEDRARRFEIRLNGEVIGDRCVYSEGEVIVHGLKNGELHGCEREWNRNGVLVFEEPYENGQVHGTARQWSDDGTLIGTYHLDRGTGLDLWRDNLTWTLSEEWPRRNGRMHGFTRFWNGDDRTVWEEHHYRDGHEHGIHREWNQKGRLRRGFPKYYIMSKLVTRREYLRACKTDLTLPPLREEENRPERQLPQEYVDQVAQGIGPCRCRVCGHVLGTTHEPRCPECGERI